MSLVIPSNVIDLEGIEDGDNSATANAINVILTALNTLLASPPIVISDPVEANAASVAGYDVKLGHFGSQTSANPGVGAEFDDVAGSGLKWRLLSSTFSAAQPCLSIVDASNKKTVVQVNQDKAGLTGWNYYISPNFDSPAITVALGAHNNANNEFDEIAGKDIFARNGFTERSRSVRMGEMSSYTPVWTTTGTAPSVGNGFISGTYVEVGKMVFFQISLGVGTTTTFGTGAWLFSLPVTLASSIGNGGSGTFDMSANFRSNTDYGFYSGQTLAPISGTPGSLGATYSATVPFAWAGGDALTLWGLYIES